MEMGLNKTPRDPIISTERHSHEPDFKHMHAQTCVHTDSYSVCTAHDDKLL